MADTLIAFLVLKKVNNLITMEKGNMKKSKMIAHTALASLFAVTVLAATSQPVEAGKKKMEMLNEKK